MKENDKNNEITKEALQDWKHNYSDSLKKGYVSFEPINVDGYITDISNNVPPNIE